LAATELRLSAFPWLASGVAASWAEAIGHRSIRNSPGKPCSTMPSSSRYGFPKAGGSGDAGNLMRLQRRS